MNDNEMQIQLENEIDKEEQEQELDFYGRSKLKGRIVRAWILKKMLEIKWNDILTVD